MNFTTFLTKLNLIQNAIAITDPEDEDETITVKRSYWGAPPTALPDLPCIINALSEPERILGLGSRDQRLRINVQLFAAKATVEDTRSASNATAFWFAAKDKFDGDVDIGGTVAWSTLRGADPTVPVLLTHGGQSYIGFNAILEIQDVEGFVFS